ncbi:hypothetical protein EVAR_20178_1 [Eumeta japonica]|uniref:Uncharacterized protein n=1 Tax=Eumeta variegata TaxID=151549 RepID=A0A4C1UU74_EUMVA|nr:hypothetical protein EVAR_20178_1 [Eumeta japonica]
MRSLSCLAIVWKNPKSRLAAFFATTHARGRLIERALIALKRIQLRYTSRRVRVVINATATGERWVRIREISTPERRGQWARARGPARGSTPAGRTPIKLISRLTFEELEAALVLPPWSNVSRKLLMTAVTNTMKTLETNGLRASRDSWGTV